MKLPEVCLGWKGTTKECGVPVRSGRLLFNPRLQPSYDIVRIPVRGKNRVKDMLDFPVFDHKSETLQQSHPTSLEGRKAQGLSKAEMLVGENWEWQVQALSRLALISSVLSGKAEETVDATSFQFGKVIPEGAGLRRTSPSARNQIPSSRVFDARNSRSGIRIDHHQSWQQG